MNSRRKSILKINEIKFHFFKNCECIKNPKLIENNQTKEIFKFFLIQDSNKPKKSNIYIFLLYQT